MIEELQSYAKGINANEEVTSWLNTTGKKNIEKAFLALKPIPLGEVEHILDFLISDAAPARLRKMSYADAKRKAKEWSDRNQKKGKDLIDSDSDIETIHAFSDGTKIVKLKTKQALSREGFLMNHCVGGYSLSESRLIYSYRDKDNYPHATFEVQKEHNEIVQIKGKGNGSIHPKYIHPILEFLKQIGMEIRPQDMVNLGYYYIHKDNIEFLKLSDAWKQVCEVNGEYYAR